MNIFAFGHRKLVGKDTFVRFLIEILRKKHSKLNIQRVGFADKLKATCHLLYAHAGHKDPSYYEHTVNSKNEKLFGLDCTVRDLWLGFGNHARLYDKDIWINPILKTNHCDILFITDLRYPNEVDAVKEAGGKVIKIENKNIVYTPDPADSALIDFNNWNEIIENNGTLQELYTLAEKWVENCPLNLLPV